MSDPAGDSPFRMRVRFDEVFRRNGDGSVSPKVPVVVGGVLLGPGAQFGARVRIGTVHFAAVQGRDLEIDRQAGVTYLLRPYTRPARPERPPPRYRQSVHPAVPIEA